MLRKNFKGTSGVIVDICAPHGIWFDEGELEKILEFVQSGAMAIADRDAAQKAQRELERFRQQVRAKNPDPEDWLRSQCTDSTTEKALAVLGFILDLIT